MRNQLKCGTEGRRQAVKASALNGIDYLELVSSSRPSIPPLIVVHFFKPVSKIAKENIVILGGTRINNIGIVWAQRADKFTLEQQQLALLLSEDEKEKIKEISETREPECYLIIRPTSGGDFSIYTLKFIRDPKNREIPPQYFDNILSSIDFSFKAESASIFDCSEEHKKRSCRAEIVKEPSLDYMAKDFASFRLLVRNRLAQIMPAWKENNVADIGIVLVEMLAYIGDHLSYYQDAVATEAYIGTSRSRISVKRHARLLDYFLNEGCNARVCVFIEVNTSFNGNIIPQGTKLLTKGLKDKVVITPEEAEREIQEEGAKVFETMHDATLYSRHNEIQFYTWSESNCCLPKGATRATLNDDGRKIKLQIGDLVLFEEVRSPSGGESDENQSHKHLIRLTKVERKVDELTSTQIIDISWHRKDALPFPLCLSEITKDNLRRPVSIARGNIVLADHGNTIARESLKGRSKSRKKFRPRLSHKQLTFRGPFNQTSPISTAFDYNPWDAVPDIYLAEIMDNRTKTRENSESIISLKEDEEYKNRIRKWKPVSDLLSSDKFSREFVVETENDGTAQIRFGDNKQGMKPENFQTDGLSYTLYATYRVGNGSDGNIGSNTISRVVGSNAFDAFGIIRVYNPMPAIGGKEPENIEEVLQKAPYAFRKQERAVTESDYVEILKMHPEIQRAAARIQWTGSWYTVYVAVDPYGRKKVDNEFKLNVQRFLDKYRLAGYDLEILEPLYVPLLIELKVYIDKDHLKSDIVKELYEIFGNRPLFDGRLGFFHPDNLSFGQPVLLSQIYAAIMKVDGVRSTFVMKFRRMDRPDHDYRDTGELQMDLFEIAQLDNDPNYPENGMIKFIVEESEG